MLSRPGMIPSPTQPPATLISLTKQNKMARVVSYSLHLSPASNASMGTLLSQPGLSLLRGDLDAPFLATQSS